MVNATPHIHLMFTDFSLQNENNTDQLYIYDGENAREGTGCILRRSPFSKGRNIHSVQSHIHTSIPKAPTKS